MEIAARIDRRILLNYRVDPAIAAALVPQPFRPRLVDGAAVAGVCLIRLSALRPVPLPAALGVRNENAAFRIAVEWDDDDGRPQPGVYIPRRETSSRLTALLGGRLFPGYHHRVDVASNEHRGRHEIRLTRPDGTPSVHVRAHEVDRLPAASVFADLVDAVEFFCGAKRAYAATRSPSRCDGLVMEGAAWQAAALAVDDLRVPFYDRLEGATFDAALVMRCDRSRWRPLPGRTVRTPAAPRPVAPPTR